MAQAKTRATTSEKKWLERWLLPLAWVLVAVAYAPWPWLPFHSSKWVLLHGVAAVGLLWLAVRAREWPSLPRKLGYVLGATAILALLHLAWFRGEAALIPALDRFSFVALLLLGWSFFRGALSWESFRWPVTAALALVSAYGLVQFSRVGVGVGGMPYTTAGSFFGHTNSAAQFTAICLLLLAALPWPPAGSRGARALLGLVMGAGLFYLVLTRGRSAQLAFAAALLALVYLRFGGRTWGRRAWVRAAAALVAVVFALGVLAALTGFSPNLQKSSLTDYRSHLWRSTLPLIAERPLGVGADNFEFRIVPYQKGGVSLSEHYLAVSPHNEWLRYLAEDGIPLSLLFAALLVWLYVAWWGKGGPARIVVLPLSVFFLLEGSVQFPFQLTFPVLVAATLFGYMASVAIPARAWPKARWAQGVRSGCVAVALLFLAGWGLEVATRRWENSADIDRAQLACRVAPGNWRACLQAARLLVADGRISDARAVVEKVLALEPANYPALRHLSSIAGMQGDRMEACFLAWKYQDVFGGKSSLQGMYEKNCPARWREYFERKRPKQYRGGWQPGAAAGPDGLKEIPLPPPQATGAGGR